MSKNLKLIKVSDLPEAKSIGNLLTLGVDSNNNSVKVPIELLKGNKGDTGESGGNLTSKSIYNITQTTGLTYPDKQTARNAVVSNLRASGQIIAYKITTGWINEQYIGADINGWGIEGNWKLVGEIPEKELIPIINSISELQDAIFILGDWKIVKEITWTDGYYIDLSGTISGGGTNTLYRLSNPIPVIFSEKYQGTLQAGNLLAISGWNGNNFNSALAVVGADTNNPVKYSFTIPDNITHIRLTCRKELPNPILEKYAPNSGTEKISKISTLETKLDILSQKEKNGWIASFTNFRNSTTIIGTGTIAGGGLLQYPVNIAIEDLDFSARIKINSIGTFGICRADTAQGTALAINKSTVDIRKMNTSTGSLIYSYNLPFTIETNKEYIVRMYKQNKDIYFSIHSDKDMYTGFAERLDTKDFGRNWGYPSIFCQSGQIEVIDTYLRDSTFKSPTTFCVGDSFIEGWGIVNNLDKRYITLMQQVTNGNVYIAGRGGETTSTLISRFNTELEKIDSDYVLLAIGTNDNVLSTYTTNMNNLITKIKASGKIPILVTVTPRSGYPITDMNNYIRNSRELYVDMNKAVNNGSETTWNPLYVNSDNVHPNISGNEAMFKRVLFDLYFLFDTKRIYQQYQI
ncbi:hypothetical protein G7051_12025 [Dysgonomonas sp. HDW5B]|uniref:SGNH/GDSL hydrolase family protein n=1 Tax=Dysgonomonas sp. HDW5B TaxID=2714927 RepID=UPI00140E6955|nr:GDSL-type esterase/lipase family protein [Dysgonomonas sp. HDW5B]QIK55026.1 hypothetical protein G7051_12025 [Dysgonomonas sp. HDW5B]